MLCAHGVFMVTKSWNLQSCTLHRHGFVKVISSRSLVSFQRSKLFIFLDKASHNSGLCGPKGCYVAKMSLKLCGFCHISS